MTDVIAGHTVSLLGQFYDFEGGTLTDLDATPTITITSVATGSTVLAATTSGVTHPGTGSYGYAWTPAASLAAGSYLVLWSGAKSGSGVTASETVTVYAAGTSPSSGPTAGVWYATREEIKTELDVRETARSNQRIDRALADATAAVEGLTHRVFYPTLATRSFDWPPRAGATPRILRLDANELISVTSVVSGGVTLAPGDYLLRRADDRNEPPYTRIEANLATNAAFGGGSTYQQDVSITGLFGYRNDETTLGTTVEGLDASETGIDVDATTSAAVGVGSLLRLDSERVIVRDRAQLDTGQTLGTNLTNINNVVTVPVQSGAAFATGEVILIDGERMRVDEIAGNTLIVTRAWDGSTIAAHTAGATIYAPRTLTVERGALGTTAATHTSGATVHRWDAPGPVRQLCIAEALTDLLQGRSGYARTAGAGENEREVSGRGIADLRDRVYTSHGRKARLRSV